MNSDNHQRNQSSHLFTVRVWIEALGYGQTEVRGQVQHVLSGETHYFRDWSKMIAYVLAKLQQTDTSDD
jgi:hypothetical protein